LAARKQYLTAGG